MNSTHYAKNISYKILNNYRPITQNLELKSAKFEDHYFSNEILHQSLLYSVIDS